MDSWRRLPYHIDRDSTKPGRVQSWFELSAVEALIGRPISWCYTNRISPGATAGSHSHQEHEVAVCALMGSFDVFLRDLTTGKEEHFTVQPESLLFTIPKNVYHEVRNVSASDGIILVFGTTRPRDEADTIYEQNS